MSTVFEAGIAEAGMRLDKFLVAQCPGTSRAQIQKEIKEGMWSIKGEKVTPHYALKAGQKVATARREKRTTKVGAIREESEGDLPALNVIAEEKDFLVIDKPAGLAVHGGPGIRVPTLVDSMLVRYPELRGIGEDVARPGVVHRLDKDVSGVMVVARTRAMFACLKKQFLERKIEKKYIALVYGTFVNDEGTIALPLRRSKSGKGHGTIKVLPRGSETEKEGVRSAHTDYQVVRRFPRMTLVHAYPHTGRMHQLRAHFRAIGHPIVGDQLYRSNKVLRVNVDLHRPFLHASSISFSDAGGTARIFTSPLAPDLKKALMPLSKD